MNWLNKLKKKQADKQAASEASSSGKFTWEDAATKALDQSLSQAPVPKMLKGTVRKQLSGAAEDAAKNRGSSTVTALDVMNGMLNKLPAKQRKKVEEAMSDPSKLADLQKKMQKKAK